MYSRLLAVFLLVLAAAPAHAAERAPLDRIVAVVNDDVITRNEFDERLRAVKQQIAEQGTPLPKTEVLERQVLDRMVLMRLELQLAEKSGIRVDDEALNRALATIASQNKMTLDQFRQTLERDGYDFASFREDIRDEITVTRLRQRQVAERVIVTEQEIDNLLAQQKATGQTGEEYRIAHILIALPQAASPEQIAAARAKADNTLESLRKGADFRETAISVSDGQQALSGGDLGWRKAAELPALFLEALPRMKVNEMSGVLRAGNGFHIIKLLEKRDTERHIVNQTLARHILIQTDELTSDEAARARLEQLRARALKGEDFAGLARAFSADKASAANGGGLGWTSPGELAPRFEEAMNALSEGEISAPFKTSFGWHIVKVEGRRQRDDTEEHLRAQAHDAIRNRKAEEELQNWQRRLRDEAYVEIMLGKM